MFMNSCESFTDRQEGHSVVTMETTVAVVMYQIFL